eukprot:5111337-Prymnesium_polylepis.1
MLALCTASAAFAPTTSLRSPVAAPRLSSPRMEKSEALPFLEKPAHLDGTYAGDVVRSCKASQAPCVEIQQRVSAALDSVKLLPDAMWAPCLAGLRPVRLWRCVQHQVDARGALPPPPRMRLAATARIP